MVGLNWSESVEGIQEVGWQRGCHTDRMEVRAWLLSLELTGFFFIELGTGF